MPLVIMDREANTSSNLKLSILHETDHTKSWRNTKKLDCYITGEVWHGTATVESALAIPEEHENVRHNHFIPTLPYVPTQRKKKRTVYTDLLLNIYGIIQIAKNLETILF